MRTSFDKIMDVARQLRSPKDGAEGPELALAGVMQGLSSPKVRDWLQQACDKGELDPFLYVLAVWLVSLRSDSEDLLIVVPVPRHRELPPGTLVHYARHALKVAKAPPPDLLGVANVVGEDDEEDLDKRGRQRKLMRAAK